jgi:acetyltransferase-like isoleucine patch superfamily enzyme
LFKNHQNILPIKLIWREKITQHVHSLKELAGSVIRRIRGYFLKRKISNKNSQIFFNNAFSKVNIVKDKSAKIIVKGKLKFGSCMGNTPVYIYLWENATLLIDGDLCLGNGVQLLVGRNGYLKIGGKETEKEASIGDGSKIYVFRKVEIGNDFLCAFNVFITDCDWHSIEYSDIPKNFHADTIIGDHVWVGHESSLLKGTIIGQGSVVGCKSVLSQEIYPKNSLIAGIPARVIKNSCKWKFDLPQT